MATIIFMNINVTKTEYSYNFDNYIFCLEIRFHSSQIVSTDFIKSTFRHQSI